MSTTSSVLGPATAGAIAPFGSSFGIGLRHLLGGWSADCAQQRAQREPEPPGGSPRTRPRASRRRWRGRKGREGSPLLLPDNPVDHTQHIVYRKLDSTRYGAYAPKSSPDAGLTRFRVRSKWRTARALNRKEPDGPVALGSSWEMTVTVAGPVATLVGLGERCQRGAHGGRGDVARVSGNASRVRRPLSKLGSVASGRGRLRRQDLQSWCLRYAYGVVIWHGTFSLEWAT